MTVLVQSVARLFDVEVQQDGGAPGGNEVYSGVTIGEGPFDNSLAVRINAGQQFQGFSKLVKAEELSKDSALTLPQGRSDWIYTECEGPRYDSARFCDPSSSSDELECRYPGKFCEQVGVFNVSRYGQSGAASEDVASPIYGPLADSSGTVQITTRWMNAQLGSFEVNLPADLDERFGGRFNQGFYGSQKNPVESFDGVVAQPGGDANNLVKRVAALPSPSRMVTAKPVDRIPLGWSPVALPFRKPQALTRNSPDNMARIYLTEEGLSGAIELTAKLPGAWGDHITLSARPSGPAIYDVALFFKGARYESARQLVRGPLPALGIDLAKPAPIGILQAKAAGVLAGVTRDGSEHLTSKTVP
jgi:hypothetical protein